VLPIFSTTIPAASPAKASATTKKTSATSASRAKSTKFRLPREQTVTTKQLAGIFSWAVRQTDIAYRYPTDGCYARAYLLISRMEKSGYTPYKVWSMENGEPLYARTKNHPNGYVTWKYHVAPIIRVRYVNDNQAWYVIDPSLFNRPVLISTWRDAQRKPGSVRVPYTTVTKLGIAPLNQQRRRLAGSGYWTSGDPREGAESHALKTMRRYKPYEGKMPPRTFAADVPVRLELVSRETELAMAGTPEVPLD
jgi:hypothetical protein